MTQQQKFRDAIDYCEERINKGCSECMKILYMDSRSVLLSALLELQIKEFDR